MSAFTVVDIQSGTFFDAESARIVSDSHWGEGDDYILDSGDDSLVSEVAEQCGSPVLDHYGDSYALNTIARMMSGSEWSVDMLDDIANILREHGRQVEDMSV